MSDKPWNECTDITNPELVDGMGRLPATIYINHTKGFWIRHNTNTDETEIWFNGNFQTSFAGGEPTVHQVRSMMEIAFELGKIKKAKDIREVLGVRQ